MDKENTNGERTGHELLPEADQAGTSEVEWRHTAEQARARHDEPTRPGGDGPGRASEGSKSDRARVLKRSHHAGRVRDELGGVLGKTK